MSETTPLRENNHSEINYQLATANDIPGVELVRRKVWASTYPKIAPEYITAGDVERIFSEPESAIQRGIETIESGDLHRRVEVAKSGEDVVGFTISKIHPDETGEILSIYILDDFQGQGIGKKLMLNAMQWMNPETRRIKLEVVATNDKAIKFYETLGFLKSRDLPVEQPPEPLVYIPHIEMIREPASIE